MNTVTKISNLLGKRTPDMSIDWEFQPSLQHLVVRTEAAPGWAETMPAEFDAIDEPVSFREPLEGLSMRDINEPEIFRLFFGEPQAAAARA
ncbi:MAG: hypothetical protein ABIR54_08610 [Burkholderiaceae bacterium]|jgi:hypothetical protein